MTRNRPFGFFLCATWGERDGYN